MFKIIELKKVSVEIEGELKNAYYLTYTLEKNTETINLLRKEYYYILKNWAKSYEELKNHFIV